MSIDKLLYYITGFFLLCYVTFFMFFKQLLAFIDIDIRVRYLLLIAFFFFIMIYAIYKLKLKIPNIFNMFLLLSIIEIIILYFSESLPIFYLLFTLYDFLAPFIVVIMWTLLIYNSNIQFYYKALIELIFILALIFAGLQHLTNDALLPIVRNNYVLSEGGALRVFAFFDSPRALAFFSIAVFYIYLLNIKNSVNSFYRLKYFLYCLLALFLLYITYIKTAYLFFIVSLLALLSMKFFLKNGLSFFKVLSLHFLTSISTILIVVLNINTIIEYFIGFKYFNSLSLLDRFRYWSILYDDFQFKFTNILFGYGAIQNDGSSEIVNNVFHNKVMIFDNYYIAIFFWGGVMGFIIFFWLYTKICVLLYKLYKISKSDAILVIFSFQIAFLFAFFTSRLSIEYSMFVLLPTMFLLKKYKFYRN